MQFFKNTFILIVVCALLTIPLGGIEILTGRRYGHIKNTRVRIVEGALWVWVFVFNSRFSFVWGVLIFLLSPVIFLGGMIISYLLMFYQIWRDEVRYQRRGENMVDAGDRPAAAIPYEQLRSNVMRRRGRLEEESTGPVDGESDVGLSPLGVTVGMPSNY